jgi:hypothetical protein
MRVVNGGSISIRINDENIPFFRPGKGVRQGDPLSPLIFNLVVDVFTRILIKAATRDYISGFLNSLYTEGIISLQYVDDTLLFLKHGGMGACHLKWLMLCFESLSGMKINYSKSDMVPVNLSEEETIYYTRALCCKIGSLPFRYLRVPLHYDKLRREDIQSTMDKIMSRIPGWQAGKINVLWG